MDFKVCSSSGIEGRMGKWMDTLNKLEVCPQIQTMGEHNAAVSLCGTLFLCSVSFDDGEIRYRSFPISNKEYCAAWLASRRHLTEAEEHRLGRLI